MNTRTWLMAALMLAACSTSQPTAPPIATKAPAAVAPASNPNAPIAPVIPAQPGPSNPASAGNPSAPPSNIGASALVDKSLPEVTISEGGKVSQLGRGSINTMKMSPDGKLIALGTSLNIRILDAGTFREVRAIPMPRAPRGTTTLAFSADSKTLATNDSDSSISLIDVASGNSKVIKGSGPSIVAISFSADGSRMAVGRADGHFQVHALPAGNVVFDGTANTTEGTTPGVQLQLAGNGRILYTTNFTDEAIMWDVDAKKEVEHLTGHSGTLGKIAMSYDGTKLATSSDDGSLRIWDAASGTLINTLAGHPMPINALAFSPDSSRLVSSDVQNSIKIWQLSDGNEVGAISDARFPEDIALGTDNTVYASSGIVLSALDAGKGSVLRQLSGFAKAPMNMVLSPDGSTLAYSDDEVVVMIRNWQAVAPRRHILTGHVSGIQSLAFSPDGQSLLSGSLDNIVMVWKVNTPEAAPQQLTGISGAVVSLGYSSDGLQIMAVSLEQSTVWDAGTGAVIHNFPHHNPDVNAATYNRARGWSAIASGNSIMLINTRDDSILRTLITVSDTFNSLTFSQDGKRLAASADSGQIFVWDTDTGNSIATLNIGNTVFAPTFSPDSSTLAFGREDRTVRVIEVSTNREVHNFTGHNNDVLSTVFADAHTLLSSSADGTVRVWRW